jgi:hypothetical protein
MTTDPKTGAEVAKIVTVRVKHRTSRPYTVWVEPVGWEPDVSELGDAVEFLDGAAWDDAGEVGGLAACFSDLGTNDPEEGEEYEVPVAELFWLSSGDCRNLGRAEVA